jgi:ABC-2 type transport system ATP-binding protein
MHNQHAVQIESLSKRYGRVLAVDSLSLRVAPGEFFGFLGPNGAGKSTTIRILSGLLRPTSGTARVLGFDVVEEPLEVKRRIGVLPEEVNVYERLTGVELLELSGRLHGLPRSEVRRRTRDLLDLVALDAPSANKLIVDYSMGMRKKITLACALIHSPRVLFLDEPFNGIDAVTGETIRVFLQRATARGLTIFFSSHVLEVVERLCTRLAIINQGRLLVEGTLAEIQAQAAVAEGTPLHRIFVDLVGGEKREGLDLSWLGDAETSGIE